MIHTDDIENEIRIAVDQRDGQLVERLACWLANQPVATLLNEDQVLEMAHEILLSGE